MFDGGFDEVVVGALGELLVSPSESCDYRAVDVGAFHLLNEVFGLDDARFGVCEEFCEGSVAR